MQKPFTCLLFFLAVCSSFAPAQGRIDTLFCGDTLSATFDPSAGRAPTDSFYVWVGNCLSRIRFDFTTADVPDAADIFYIDLAGNLSPAGSVPYFGASCTDSTNHFNDPQLPIESALQPNACVEGFLEVYGRGIPFQDSVVQRSSMPADFKLSGNRFESARLHLDIPSGVVALMFVVKYNPVQSTVLQALWDCTPACCITATGEEVCVGQNIQLGTEQEAFAYRWRGPGGFTSTERAPLIPAADRRQEGWYVVEGEYLFGCRGIDSVYIGVHAPEVQLDQDTLSVCLGGSASLHASGAATYLWDSAAAGLLQAQGPDAVVAPQQPATYEVIGRDEYGCTDTAYALVEPTTLQLSTRLRPPSCAGYADGRVVLTLQQGQAPVEIRLDGGSWHAGDEVDGLPAGTYTIEVRDALGCLASTEVVLEDPPPLEGYIGIQDPSCRGACDAQIAVLVENGKPPFEYFTNGARTDSISQGYCAGTFPITVTDAKGCQWQSAFTVEDPPPFTIDLGKNKKIREGESLSLQIEASQPLHEVQWEGLCESACPSTLSLQPDSSMMVYVTAWTTAGCMARDSLWVLVKKKAKCQDGLYAPTAFTPNQDGINEYFTLYADTETSDVVNIERLIIFNQWGRKVFDRGNLTPGDAPSGWDGRVDGTPVPGGTYAWVGIFERSDGLRFRCNGTVVLLR
ncbi:MAG: gliding motility-associated C-terminal domain-containing protein [Bacteroidetes bacterium]|nr:MAG: gliding motility-associated C-terminal domain-containing protein [Bacteroidota bacterium]